MITIPSYNQILRINPETKPAALKKFKEAIRCTNEQGFDLNGIKEEPQELLDRNYGETVSTSSDARKESRQLCRKYGADNIIDWRRHNWYGVTENIDTAIWKDEFTVYLKSEEKLSQLMIELAIKYKIEMYFSFVKDCDATFEDNCGLLKIKEFPEYFALGTDRFEKFVFGSVLAYRTPLTFENWETWEIPVKNSEMYYEEHFLEPNARERMEEAFNNSNHICLANTMTNEEIGSKRTWAALSKLF